MEKISKILALIGIIASIAGFILNDILIDFTLYFNIIESVSILSFIFFFLVNFNILKAFSKQRSAKYGAVSIFGAVIFTAILVIINIISTYHSTRIDLSEKKLYSLADQSINILKGLKKDVLITAFFKKASNEEKIMGDILGVYKDQSDKITFDFVDPDLNPIIANKYNINDNKDLMTTVFECGDKEFRINPTSSERLEEMITNAILKVSKEEKKDIYFTLDHGEYSIDDSTKAGFSYIKSRLENTIYNVKNLSLLREGKIPDECDVLVIPNPTKPFLPDEMALIEDYIENKNGKLIFLVDIDTDPSLTSFLEKYGFLVNNDVIIDTSQELFGNLTRVLVEDYHREEVITKDFRVPTVFSMARSIIFTLPFEPYRKYVPLAKTVASNQFRKIWGETKLDSTNKVQFDQGEDFEAPLELVGILTYDGALKRGERQYSSQPENIDVSKIVVFGDSSFISNEYFNFNNNADLFNNAINYLAQEYDMISVSPKKTTSSTILLSDSKRSILYYFSIFIFPILIFIAGIVVWLRRRNL